MPKDDVFKASQSKVKTWLRCRRAYWYRYVEKLRRKRIKRPFAFGRMAHDMLEAHINEEDPFEVLKGIEKEQGKMFRSEIDEYGDIVGDARIIMSEYFDYYENSGVRFLKFNGKRAEFTFSVEVVPGIIVEGRIDAYAQTKNKLKWLVEHKTMRSMPNEDHRWRSVQSVVYLKISEMAGLPQVEGTMWDQIMSKPPSALQFKENGEPSKRKINTLPMKLLQDLKAERQDPAKFRNLLKAAEDNRKNYFQRVFNPTKPKVVSQVFKDFVDTIKEMRELHGTTKVRNIDRHCDWCDYEGICRAELTGLDADFIRKKEYTVHEKPEEDVEPDFEG